MADKPFKPLWNVTVTMDLVVSADSAEEANELAEFAARDAARDGQLDVGGTIEITHPRLVPDGWMNALPWTGPLDEREREYTVAEVLKGQGHG